jgi:hypothetical protein
VSIRCATPADARGVQILAELDEARVPAPPLLLGFVDEELWAAVSMSTGAVIADPFRPSAQVVPLLLQRARQLAPDGREPRLRRRRRRWQPAAGSDARRPARVGPQTL